MYKSRLKNIVEGGEGEPWNNTRRNQNLMGKVGFPTMLGVSPVHPQCPVQQKGAGPSSNMQNQDISPHSV